MSHPERLSSSGGESVDTLAERPGTNGHRPEKLADFAARFGLKQSAARPPLRKYIAEVWQRRTFIWAFASARTRSRYTNSRLGQLWQVLTPLLNVGVYYLIFGLLLNSKRGVTNFMPFLVTGVFIFSFTQNSITAGAKSISSNLSLIRALHFPRASLPFSYVVIELQQLLISMAVMFVIILGFGEPLMWSWLLIVPILLLQMVFNMGAALVLARVGAFTPDVQQLLPFILRTWLYASGVIFFLPALAHKMEKLPILLDLMRANPGYVYLELSRTVLLKSYNKDLTKYHWHDTQQLWIYAIAWAVVGITAGFWYFYRAEDRYGRG
ncbi:ABC transporter permease [Actinomadura barringtoniae]|uniref:Transport permease protein n=1 Tax=Actinomadura barringtoniae TaxID=1427535 RepID=A0A939T2Y9_9ACTN|nr:ABC transporter permease [Actinomadura barringtoniae]MBO2447323.1 ABC transporter permease [Actinomadura barringtoniae]